MYVRARHTRTVSRRRSRGQSLVEFAVVLPVFLLVLCGIMDFGFMLYSRMSVINSTREGARAVVAYTDPTLVNQIPAVARGQVTGTSNGLITDGMVTVQCVRTAGSCSFVANTPPAAGDAKPGDAVRVSVTYPYRPFFPLLFGTTINLTSQTQMTLE
jgi:Flp pilus assembly protein TadG